MGIYDGLLRVYRNLRLVHMNLRLVHMNLRLVHMNALCFSSITLLALVIWNIKQYSEGWLQKKRKVSSFAKLDWWGGGGGVQTAICYEPVVAETSSVFENISERVHFKVFLIVVLMDPPMVSVVPKVNPKY